MRSLQTPFTGAHVTAMERLRSLLIDVAHDDGSVESERSILYRAVNSDLRGLLATKEAVAPEPGANTGALAVILERLAPRVGELERAALELNVTRHEFRALKTYLQHPLPNRRVTGYCALLCLCAERTEV